MVSGKRLLVVSTIAVSKEFYSDNPVGSMIYHNGQADIVSADSWPTPSCEVSFLAAPLPTKRNRPRYIPPGQAGIGAGRRNPPRGGNALRRLTNSWGIVWPVDESSPVPRPAAGDS